jgi:hypothetical protein
VRVSELFGVAPDQGGRESFAFEKTNKGEWRAGISAQGALQGIPSCFGVWSAQALRRIQDTRAAEAFRGYKGKICNTNEFSLKILPLVRGEHVPYKRLPA